MKSLTAISPLFITLLLGVSACKTQDQISRDQMMNNMSIQMVESQKISSHATTRLQAMEEKLAALQGQTELSGHQQKEASNQKFVDLENRLKLLEQENELTKKQMMQVLVKLDEQDKFLKKVLSTINKKVKTSQRKKKTKVKALSPYAQAMSDYKRGRYTKSKAILKSLLDSNKIKKRNLPHTLHNLGMISYIQKDDESAMVYFSKLFTEYSKSNFNANGLLFLAKSFERQKQKDNAKQTLQQLVEKFPKAKQVKEAKKLIAKLK